MSIHTTGTLGGMKVGGWGVITKISYLLWELKWYSSSFYHSLLSNFFLFPCGYCVHPNTIAHTFNIDPYPKNLYRKSVEHGTKRPKWLKLSPNKKKDWSGDHLSPLILHNQLQYHLSVDAYIIFRYQKLFFDIPKLLWDDIRSYNITDGWMLTSSLNMQKCFLIFLNLTK